MRTTGSRTRRALTKKPAGMRASSFDWRVNHKRLAMVDETRIHWGVKQHCFIFASVEKRAGAGQCVRCGVMQPSRFYVLPLAIFFRGLARV
jgi:hypothetical protein